VCEERQHRYVQQFAAFPSASRLLEAAAKQEQRKTFVS